MLYHGMPLQQYDFASLPSHTALTARTTYTLPHTPPHLTHARRTLSLDLLCCMGLVSRIPVAYLLIPFCFTPHFPSYHAQLWDDIARHRVREHWRVPHHTPHPPTFSPTHCHAHHTTPTRRRRVGGALPQHVTRVPDSGADIGRATGGTCCANHTHLPPLPCRLAYAISRGALHRFCRLRRTGVTALEYLQYAFRQTHHRCRM